MHHLNDVGGGDLDAVDDRRFFTKVPSRRQACVNGGAFALVVNILSVSYLTRDWSQTCWRFVNTNRGEGVEEDTGKGEYKSPHPHVAILSTVIQANFLSQYS